MNRREFATSLGTAAAAAAFPLSVIGATAGAPAAVSQSLYNWAQLIARAQSGVSPAMLARRLNVAPHTAQTVFNALLQSGAIKSGMAGALQATGHSATAPQAAAKRLQAAWTHMRQSDVDADALVIADDPALECGHTCEKDRADASPDQSIQEGPQSG